MKHLDLFSGIGGFAYAAQKVWGKDYECVGFCEIDKYCQQLLKIRFPGVKIYEDIKKLSIENTECSGRIHGEHEEKTNKIWEQREFSTGNGERLYLQENGFASENDITSYSKGWSSGKSTKWKRGKNISGGNSKVDLLTGGFPCQPFSMAGKRKGTSDDRHLWPEMFRVIKEFKPRWIIGENVFGITNMAQHESEPDMEADTDNGAESTTGSGANGVLWDIIQNLDSIGYTVQTFVIPACAVNAPHRRDRIWIVANSGHGHGKRNENKGKYEKEDRQRDATKFERPIKCNDTGIVANSNATGQQNRSEQYRWSKAQKRKREYSIIGCNTNTEFITNSESERGKCGECGECGEYTQCEKRLFGRNDTGTWNKNWIEVATELCGVDDGLSAELHGFKLSKAGHRVHRLKALGNAIVPQVVMQLMEFIKEVDNETRY